MRLLSYTLIAFAVFGFCTLAEAQSTRQPLRAQVQLQATTASEPSLREALQDPEVQAALRQYVHGIDVNNPFREYSDFPLTPPETAPTDESALEPFRQLSERYLQSFERRGARPGRMPPEGQERDSGGLEIRPIPAEPVPPPGASRPHLDVELFCSTLDALFQNNVQGYELRVRRHGQTICTHQYGWAQRPEDSGFGWNPSRRQHVASVSKFITAMGLAHMLDAQGISFDTPIIDYLPDYWVKGPNIEDITFADLMNHISGFHGSTSGNSNYIAMRARVGAGVAASDVGNWATADYQNMNFGLCRVLMAVLGGYIDKSATFGNDSDVIWNWVSVVAYAIYINHNIFAPAGVTNASLSNSADSARAYAWDDTGQGYDSGNLTGETGGAGWHLSADEILDVVGEFRRGGTIFTPQRAIELMNLSYGLNSPPGGFPSDAGPVYYKMGRWWNGDPDHQAEQSLIMVVPEDIEIAVLVNSPLGPSDEVLQNFVGSLYLLSIVSGN